MNNTDLILEYFKKQPYTKIKLNMVVRDLHRMHPDRTTSDIQRSCRSLVSKGVLSRDGMGVYYLDPDSTRTATNNHFSEDVKLAALRRYDHRCMYTGSRDRLQVDHLRSRADGGSDDIENAGVCTETLNICKQANTLWRQYPLPFDVTTTMDAIATTLEANDHLEHALHDAVLLRASAKFLRQHLKIQPS